MSRASAAKKARRKRRIATRNDRWLPTEVRRDIADISRIADEIHSRGWVYDEESSVGDMLTWYYPPSGVELDDDATESVTRIWFTEPTEPQVLLVGSTEDSPLNFAYDVDELLDALDEIEAYRMGDSPPPTAR